MTSRMFTREYGLVVGLLLLTGMASAQPGDGHVVLSVNTTQPSTRQFTGSLVVYDPGLDRFSTLVRTTPRYDTVDAFGALSMASDNRDLMALGSGPGGGIIQTYRRVTVAGVIYDARGVHTVTNTHWLVLR